MEKVKRHNSHSKTLSNTVVTIKLILLSREPAVLTYHLGELAVPGKLKKTGGSN
jgi:hypothetical protein